VFADGLTFPNGVMPWKGGVYVTCAPYLYYFKDTDGDGKADYKGGSVQRLSGFVYDAIARQSSDARN
jgi:hypothetical protein